jgi:thiamine kinase-like enzyme
MSKPFYKEALQAFSGGSDSFAVQALDGGLINHTYKITNSNTGESSLLQRINHQVFTRPDFIQENYKRLFEYLKAMGINNLMPALQYFPGHAELYKDSNGNFWRVTQFIHNGKMLSNAETPEQAGETARTFAEFTAAFTDFNISLLRDTIPDFHNLSFRYHQFADASTTNLTSRKEKAAAILQELQQRKKYVELYTSFLHSVDYPKRVMHHDAKIANILFSNTTGQVICLVDLDTTMPGYFFSDLGDMIRSMACSHDENSTRFETICIRKNFYDAILEGYLQVMGKQLTQAEKKHIHYSGIIIIYMQALRFISDYLNGDIYYKTDYPEQNLERAMNQLTLLQSLENLLKEQKEI